MSSPAERLAHAVAARRNELHLTQLQVWQDNQGPSNTKLTEIENGRLTRLTWSTAKKLDRSLGWVNGSAMRVWEGKGDPIVRAGEVSLRAMVEAVKARNYDLAQEELIIRALESLAEDPPSMERGAS